MTTSFPAGSLGSWVSSPAVAVASPTASGTVTAPVGTTYTKAKITNSTPWVVTVLGALGSQTIQPYTYDLVPVIPPNGVVFNYANAPGGPATSPAGQPCYIQVDWWIGSADPPGTYPGQLIAQAVAASIAAVVDTATTQFTAVSNESIANNVTGTYALDSFVYPSGLTAANFHAAAVAINLDGATPGGQVAVYLLDENDNALWQSVFDVPAEFPSAAEAALTMPIPLTFGTLNGTCAIVVVNNEAGDLSVDVVLDQEPNTPGVLLAGVQAGAEIGVTTTAAPTTGTANQAAALSTAGTSNAFGPTTAATSLWVTLSCVIYTLTCSAVGSLQVEVVDTTTGQLVAAMLLPLPLTAGFPAALEAVDVTVPVNYPHAAAAGGAFTLKTSILNATVSGITGRALAVVGYR